MSRSIQGQGKTQPSPPSNGAHSPRPVPPRFDLIALVASAGGLEALSAVLRDLPPDFPAAIIVAQHLGGQGSTLVEVLGRRTPLAVEWASAGARLTPGRVLVCPPRRQLEVLPDGSCAISGEITVRDKPLDLLLESISDSSGPRALAVVLTGMGKDAASGAAAVKRAGGVVLVQDEETAEQPSMPRAVIAAGAADLVLPLHEIAGVIATLVRGGDLPRSHDEVKAAKALFAGDGEVRRLLRSIDWSRTSVGPLSDWPGSLRTTLRVVLDNPLAMTVLWGPDLIQLYNDQYRVMMGSKHPSGLAQSNRACWPEVWHLNQPIYARVLSGESVALTDALYPVSRRGTVEDAWFDLSFAPVRDETGTVAGVLVTVVETTDRVLSQRRLRTLQALTASTGGSTNVLEAMQRALAALGGTAGDNGNRGDSDVPFALAYLLSNAAGPAQLVASMGAEPGGPLAPRTIDPRAGHPAWPLGSVLGADSHRSPVLLDDLAQRFRGLLPDAGERAPTSAILLPLGPSADEPPAGVLICGINPRLMLDAGHRGFFELVAARISASLVEAQVRQKERHRLDQLAELDQAKTEFFSNISHEFRTPLTLLLAPLEELSRREKQLPESLRSEIQIATRNARRLLNQVNTLLDFSQVEANRMRPRFEPVDLAALTVDVASVFRGAAQRAGLALAVDAPPLRESVWVDRSMWEKIVSNLLSNALKFTLEGSIAVELRALPKHVELVVRDTGVGIPAAELPHIFERFHRVRSSRARTHEGAGIGLALVYELVRRHHGRVRVQSREGGGSTFTIWLPLGARPVEGAAALPRGDDTVPAVASALAQEAERWTSDPALPEELVAASFGDPKAVVHAPGARVLVVDDNADMRDYLRRLLSPTWQVETAADGEEALRLARETKPELVLADVMMPKLDGFGLLRALRGDVALSRISVVLLTARAGEEAAIEGLKAGADDYIAKPFSARELVARVGGQLELARMRRRLSQVNEFLVRFSDAVRGLIDPVEIQRTACRMLHWQLGVERAYWAEVDSTTREYVVAGGVHSPGVSPIEGRFRMDDWDPFSSERHAHVVDDMQTDPRIPASVKESAAQLGIGADLAVPVVVDGQVRSVLALNQREPRHWTPEETALIHAVATRCWGEVERARAQAAVRASEAKYRTVFESMDEGFNIHEVIRDDTGKAIDYRLLESNPAYTRITGLPRETIGKLGSEYMPDVEGYWLETMDQVSRSGVAERAEMYNAPSGRWYNMQVTRVAGYPNRLGIVFDDVTARKEAELGQAYLLKLSDALRPLTDAAEIESAACRLLGEHLGTHRAYYVALDEAAGLARVERQYLREGATSSVGSHSLEAFGWSLAPMRRGEPIVVDDIHRDDLVPAADVPAMEAVQQAAIVAVPLVKDGVLVGVLCASEAVPRSWQPAEVALVHETAERTWAAAQRARAEAALRESEAHLAKEVEDARVLQEISNQLVSEAAPNGHYNHIVEAARRLMRSDAASIQELDAADSRLKLLAHTGFHAESAAFWAYVDADVGSSCGRALTARKRVVVPDMDTFEAAPHDIAAYRKSGIMSVQSTPLVASSGHIVGTMSTHWNHPHTPSAECYRFFDILARLAADFMERARTQTALRESEAKIRTIFETMTEACCIFELIYDERGMPVDWRILEANAGYERQSGLKDVAGKLASEVMPGTEPYWIEAFGRVAETGVAEQIEKWHQPTDRWIHSSTARVGGPGSRRLVSVFYDITERKRAEQRTAADLEAVTRLQRAGAFCARVDCPESDVVAVLLDTAVFVTAAAKGHLQLLDAATGRLRIAAQRGFDERFLEFFDGVAQGDAAACGAALDAGSRVAIPDVRESEVFRGKPALQVLLDAGVRAVQSTPLLSSSGRVLGMISTHYSEPHAPSGAELGLMDLLARQAADYLARRQTEEALRQSDERQAFLLKLSDALRPLSEAAEITIAATGVLGRHLGVNRAFYAEVQGDAWIVSKGYEEGVPTLADGPYLADRYGAWIMQTYRAGERIVFDDTRDDPRFAPAERDAHAASEIIGAVGVPLVKNGTLVAILAVHTAAARRWTEAEIRLVEETAERTWAAAERARTEMRLGESEEKYRTLFETMDEGYLIGEVVFDANHEAIDILYLHANPAAIRLAGRDFTGQRMRDIDPRYEAYWYETYGRVALTGESVRAEHYAEPHGRWFDFRLSRIGGPGSRRVASIFQDITERKLAERALAEELRSTKVLQDLGVRLIAEGDIQTICEAILTAAIDITRADAGTVQIMDDEAEELVVLATRGFSQPMQEYFHRVDARSTTSCGLALRSGERSFVDFDPASAELPIRLHVGDGILSAQSSPLVSRTGKAIGMVSTHWREAGHRPTERELRFLDLLVREAADIIERQRAEQALRATRRRAGGRPASAPRSRSPRD